MPTMIMASILAVNDVAQIVTFTSTLTLLLIDLTDSFVSNLLKFELSE